MQVLDIDRVIVATEDVHALAETLDSLLGIKFGAVFEEDGLESCISRDNSKLDLVAPESAGDAADAVTEFLQTRGPGLYGVALRVDDVEAARAELAENGIEPVYVEDHNEFLEYFYHPKHFGGIFIALSEFPHAAEMNIKIAKGITDRKATD